MTGMVASGLSARFEARNLRPRLLTAVFCPTAISRPCGMKRTMASPDNMSTPHKTRRIDRDPSGSSGDTVMTFPTASTSGDVATDSTPPTDITSAVSPLVPRHKWKFYTPHWGTSRGMRSPAYHWKTKHIIPGSDRPLPFFMRSPGSSESSSPGTELATLPLQSPVKHTDPAAQRRAAILAALIGDDTSDTPAKD